MRVAIVGGGIGGLSAALFLRARGVEVDVFEQNAGFQETGAGIVVSPNMVRPLRRLGLEAKLVAFAVKLEWAWEFRDYRDGRIISATPIGEACERLYGAPCYVVHRADLRAMLRDALPEGLMKLDRRCVGVAQDSSGVELTFQDAMGKTHVARADVAIGADGIHSTLREAVGAREAPRFAGLSAFRCLVPAERAPAMALRPAQTLWLGPGRHFVHYPISAGRFVNVVAFTPAGDWRSESWTADGSVEDLAAEFEGWDPRLHQLIRSATQTKRWAAFDRAPLESWTRGRLALLGDAAHAMLPFLAQGAAQCVEDAEALAQCLADVAPVDAEAALKRYEAQRAPRANAVLLGSRGREIRNHLPDGPERDARDAALAASDPLGDIAWLYGEGGGG